ncbi:hypothetical protein Ahia01_000895200, partial [Argonauta hians]
HNSIRTFIRRPIPWKLNLGTWQIELKSRRYKVTAHSFHTATMEGSRDRLTFEERKQVLKFYFKYENISEVRRQWTLQFRSDAPSRLTISRIRDKFEEKGTVQDVCAGQSGRPRTSRSDDNVALVIRAFEASPKISTRRASQEMGISQSTVCRILKDNDWGNMPKHKNLSDSDSDSGPEDRNPVSKKKKPEKKVEKPTKKPSGDDDEKMFQLSKMRYATVSEFRGKVLIGIREYYEADGELRPGKKGISLNVEQWKNLKNHMDDIDSAIEQH